MQIIQNKKYSQFIKALEYEDQIPIQQTKIQFVRQQDNQMTLDQQRSSQFLNLLSRIRGNIQQYNNQILSLISQIQDEDLIDFWVNLTQHSPFTVRMNLTASQGINVNIPMKIYLNQSSQQIYQKFKSIMNQVFQKAQNYYQFVFWLLRRIKIVGGPSISQLIELMRDKGISQQFITKIQAFMKPMASKIQGQQQFHWQYFVFYDPKLTCWQNVYSFLKNKNMKGIQNLRNRKTSLSLFCQENNIGLVSGQTIIRSSSQYTIVFKQQRNQGSNIILDHIFIVGDTHMFMKNKSRQNMKPKKVYNYDFQNKILRNIYIDIQCFGDISTQTRERAQIQRIYMISMVVQWDNDILEPKTFRLPQYLPQQLGRYLLINQFCISFDQIITQYPGLWHIWAYNGINYDYQYLLPIILNNLYPQAQVLGKSSSPKGFIIQTENSILKFLDTKTVITSGSLSDNSKKYNKIWKKMNFNISNVNTMEQYIKNMQLIQTYNQFDCLSMMQLLKNHYQTLWNYVQKCAISKNKTSRVDKQQFLRKWTVPSMAYYLFQRVFLKSIIQPDQKYYQLHKRNYFGGCTQVWRHTTTQELYQLDVNAQYPTSMVKFSPPAFFIRQEVIQQYQIQKQIYMIKNSLCDNHFYQIIQFDLRQSACTIGVPLKSTLIYPNIYRQQDPKLRKWMWGVQIKPHLLFSNSTFVFTKKLVYSSLDPVTKTQWSCFKDYILMAYQYRQKAKQQKNQLMDNITKLFQNSLYGKFAQALFQSVFVKWNEGYEYFEKQSQQQQQQKKSKFHVGEFVRFSSYIASGARSILSQYIYKIGVQNVWYMDTDSLYTNKKGYQRAIQSNILSETQLGKMKLQRILQKAFFIGKKFYIAQLNAPKMLQMDLIKKQKIDSKFKNNPHFWTLKSKGINTNQRAQVMKQLYYYCHLTYDLAIKIWRVYPSLTKVLTIMKMQSIVWQKQKKQGYGVTRMEVLKRANFIFQRQPFFDGTTQALTYQQAKQYKDMKTYVDNQVLMDLTPNQWSLLRSLPND